MGLFPEPRSDVYCFRLNFNISKLGYCKFDFRRSLRVSGVSSPTSRDVLRRSAGSVPGTAAGNRVSLN